MSYGDYVMCEIYGFSGKRKSKLNNDLSEFFSHSSYHPHGWGLALFDGSNAEIRREIIRADRSEYLEKLFAKPILSKNALAHIRLATIGNVELDNCHPFTAKDKSGRSWTLIHNGTIFETKVLKKYIFLQKGETDSERILLYIVDRMNQKISELDRKLSARERFDILDEIIGGSSSKNKLNLLIFDGEITYAFTNYRDSLFLRQDEYGATFSTCPLTNDGWERLQFTVLLGFCNGSQVLSGKPHGNEYFFEADSYKPLYMAYAGL